MLEVAELRDGATVQTACSISSGDNITAGNVKANSHEAFPGQSDFHLVSLSLS